MRRQGAAVAPTDYEERYRKFQYVLRAVRARGIHLTVDDELQDVTRAEKRLPRGRVALLSAYAPLPGDDREGTGLSVHVTHRRRKEGWVWSILDVMYGDMPEHPGWYIAYHQDSRYRGPEPRIGIPEQARSFVRDLETDIEARRYIRQAIQFFLHLNAIK